MLVKFKLGKIKKTGQKKRTTIVVLIIIY